MTNKFVNRALFVTLVVLSLITLPGVSRAQDKVKITFWDWWVTQGPAMDATIADFMAAHPNITVEKRTIGGGPYNDTINLAFQGDSAPDVFVVEDTNLFKSYIANGWVLPLSGLPDFEKWKATFPNPGANFTNGVNVIDGKAYSAPLFVQGPWLQLYVNTKVYKDAGLVNADGSVKLPKTLDEMIANSRVIKDKSGGKVYGFGVSGTQGWAQGWWWWNCQMTSHFFSVGGLDGFNALTGKFEWSTNPCIKQDAQALVKMRDEKLIYPDASIDDEGARAKFADGSFGHLIGGSWVIAGWSQTHPNFKDYTATTLPLVGVTQPGGYFYKTPGGQEFAISAKSQHPNEAWELIKWLYGPNMGKTWADKGNGLTFFTPGTSDKYATNDAWKSIFAMTPLNIDGPQPALRNPNVSKVQFTLNGPDPNAVLGGILSGQITDIDAALKDLDARMTTALNNGLQDATAAGTKVSLDDFIFKDWDPTKPYQTQPTSSMAATMAATATK